MGQLIFVRHAMPHFEQDQPASSWKLSPEGRVSSRMLGRRLAMYKPDVIITSHEPKAAETGQIIGDVMNVPVFPFDGLHEHLRETVPWYDDQKALKAKVLQVFDEPDQLILGEETADEASNRFTAAVKRAVAAYPERNIVIVTHGTVMTLFTQQVADIDPHEFWPALGLPAFVVFNLPDFELAEIVNDIQDDAS